MIPSDDHIFEVGLTEWHIFVKLSHFSLFRWSHFVVLASYLNKCASKAFRLCVDVDACALAHCSGCSWGSGGNTADYSAEERQTEHLFSAGCEQKACDRCAWVAHFWEAIDDIVGVMRRRSRTHALQQLQAQSGLCNWWYLLNAWTL